jgi:hypothetical protein
VWNRVLWVGVVQADSTPYGVLVYSYDGVTWVESYGSTAFYTGTSPNLAKPVGLAWNSNYWVVGGHNNIMLYSLDGKLWNALPAGASLVDISYQIAPSFQPLVGYEPDAMVTNYVAGNEPYATGTSGAAGQFLKTTTVGTTATAIYELGPIVTVSTTKLILMANVCLINQAYSLVMTVGRATTSGASIGNSSNIVADAAMWTNPPTSPSYYMAAYAGTTQGDAKAINLTGFCIDTPGPGTFYYTMWMTSSTSATYANMTVALTAMTIKS